MTTKNKLKAAAEVHTRTSSPVCDHKNLDSAAPERQPGRPVRFFEFWRGVGQQVNDNHGRFAAPRFHFVAFAATGLLFCLLAGGLNSSAVVTQVALHGGPVMSMAMSADPDMVAYALNKIDVGGE